MIKTYKYPVISEKWSIKYYVKPIGATRGGGGLSPPQIYLIDLDISTQWVILNK